MPKGVSNPYAKKARKPSNTDANPRDTKAARSVPQQDNANTTTANAKPIGELPNLGGATFSQAFASLEDTSRYQQVLQETAAEVPPPPTNPQNEKERLEQREIDFQEAADAAAEAAVGPNAADRDHHVLLQPHVLYVSPKQRGNEVLKYIRNVPFAYSKMVPDYIMGTTSCALFLSLKYHQLYPNYIHRRLAELKTDFRLRVLLVLVDVENCANALLFLNHLAVTNNLTLVLAWTEQEAARYLETYKALDGKDATSIQKKESTNFYEQNADFMTACKPVNKTDAGTILSHFGTIKAVAAATQDELGLCEGLGPIKIQKLFDALHKPFSKSRSTEARAKQDKSQNNDELEETSQPPSLAVSGP
eukprot:Nitzschia sp. Nitz4//scaffold140_size61219//10436//11521//NITZ4_006432-RA/size61219-processed-gene-0.16-mRNA-1//-1//CDS//3329536203//9315//frame0